MKKKFKLALSCPTGLLFDVKMKRCFYAANVSCAELITTTPVQTTTTSQTSTTTVLLTTTTTSGN